MTELNCGFTVSTLTISSIQSQGGEENSDCRGNETAVEGIQFEFSLLERCRGASRWQGSKIEQKRQYVDSRL